MSIKIKIIKESKLKNEELLKESLISLFTDPVMVSAMMGVAALGYGALKKMEKMVQIENESPDAAFNRILGDDWRKQASDRLKKEKTAKASRKAEYDRMRSDYLNSLPDNSANDAMSLPMKDDGAGVVPSGNQPSEGDIRRYAKSSAIANDPNAAEGDVANARRKMAVLLKIYPNIEELASKAVYKEAKEIFRRFMV